MLLVVGNPHVFGSGTFVLGPPLGRTVPVGLSVDYMFESLGTVTCDRWAGFYSAGLSLQLHQHLICVGVIGKPVPLVPFSNVQA